MAGSRPPPHQLPTSNTKPQTLKPKPSKDRPFKGSFNGDLKGEGGFKGELQRLQVPNSQIPLLKSEILQVQSPVFKDSIIWILKGSGQSLQVLSPKPYCKPTCNPKPYEIVGSHPFTIYHGVQALETVGFVDHQAHPSLNTYSRGLNN